MRLIFLLFVVVNNLFLLSASHAANVPDSCVNSLDLAVSMYNKGLLDDSAKQLEQLSDTCAHLPQVHHNLGVIAGVRQQWHQASEHFERAIDNDSRTRMTQSHLQSIHEFKAALAYRKALGVKGAVDQPQLLMQKSTDANVVIQLPPTSDLHTISTVDYELFSWWNSAANGSTESWLEHYAVGYPPLENEHAKVVEWDKVGRDIAFSTQDAVVVLNYQLEDVEKRVLLLMRLQNNRWKIYRETTL